MRRQTRGGGILPCRRVFCFSLIGSFTRLVAEDFTVIDADEPWYRERSEAEQEWRGVLRKREREGGPGSRDSLRFMLQTRDRVLTVYGAGAGGRLSRFTGKRIVARAKLVDLRSEGFGQELWIGSVRVAD